MHESARRARCSLRFGRALLLCARPRQCSPRDAARRSAVAKLRGDLAALVAGRQTLDRRIPALIAGYHAGEIPYFAVLTEPDDAARAGRRSPRSAHASCAAYRSIDAFALASARASSRRSLRSRGSTRMAPVEVVTRSRRTTMVDQTRGRPPTSARRRCGSAGITGTGVRIAVLDTGLDATHPTSTTSTSATGRGSSQPAEGGRLAQLHRRRNARRAATQDGHGHGTHVAGHRDRHRRGRADGSDDTGEYAGIAPGRRARRRQGARRTPAPGSTATSIAAMEWAAMPADLADRLRGRRPDREHEPRLRGAAARGSTPSSDVDLVELRRSTISPSIRDAVRGGRRQQRSVHRQRARGAGLGVAGAQRRSHGQGLRRQSRRHALRRHVRRLAHTPGAAGRPATCSARRRRPAASLVVVLLARPVRRRLAAPGPRRARLQHRLGAGRDRDRARRQRPEPPARAPTRCTRPRRAPRWRRRPRPGARRSSSRPTAPRYGGASPFGASGIAGLAARRRTRSCGRR